MGLLRTQSYVIAISIWVQHFTLQNITIKQHFPRDFRLKKHSSTFSRRSSFHFERCSLFGHLSQASEILSGFSPSFLKQTSQKRSFLSLSQENFCSELFQANFNLHKVQLRGYVICDVRLMKPRRQHNDSVVFWKFCASSDDHSW